MAALNLARPARPRPTARTKHPKAYIATAGGIKLVLPFAPITVDHSGFADVFDNVDRPGRKPLVLDTADGLRTMSTTVTIGYADAQQSIEAELATLRKIAESGDRCTVSLSALERGGWRLTDLTITATARQYGSNATTRADAAVTFTEAIDLPAKVGKTKPKPKPTKGRAGNAGHTADKFYVVHAGDTLAGIAHRFGVAKWQTIADANGVRDPRKLKVGQRLRIPAGA